MRSKLLYIIIALLIAAFAAYLLQVAFVGDPLDGYTPSDEVRLVQEGMDVTANWDPMDCDSYDVTVLIDGRITKIDRTPDNYYIVEGVYPGQHCQVLVRAGGKGLFHRHAKAVLTADKIKQNIKVDDTIYYGFAGNDVRLKASANGELHYRSTDKSIAKVDQSGNVTFEKDGEADVVINAEGNGFFDEGEREIHICVYPAELDKVTGTSVENISPTRAVISWKPDEYAAAYKVLRRNPATGEYTEITETPAETTYFEVTRDDRDYGIKGIAEVNDVKVDGKLSDPVEVRGTTQEAQSYPKFKIIQKIKKEDLDVVANIQGVKGVRVPQSLNIIEGNYVVTYVNKKGTRGRLITYDKSGGSAVQTKDAKGIGHGNGSTYNPNTNCIYVLSTKTGEASKKCYIYNADTKRLLKKFNLPVAATAISYDISTNQYYLADSKKMFLCDNSFKVLKTLKKTVPNKSTQDIGAYNGAVLVCAWPGKSKSYIDMYRVSDGAYIGSYDVSFGEIESCAVEDGYLIFIMNTIGSVDDKIYKTKERIAIP